MLTSDTVLSDYKDEFPSFRFSRDEQGILEMAMHTNGSTHVHAGKAHTEFPAAFRAVGSDASNEVVILTGTGEGFLSGFDRPNVPKVTRPEQWFRTSREARLVLNALLDIPVPVIAAINGPAQGHFEYALTCDIAIASDTAYFENREPQRMGAQSGNGLHWLLASQIGEARSRYFVWTNGRISAEQALAWGIVQEIVPHNEVLKRAHELAEELLLWPALARRYMRLMFSRNLRSIVNDCLPGDMAMQGITMAASSVLLQEMTDRFSDA